MHYYPVNASALAGAMACEDCGVLVLNTVAHDRHHRDLVRAARQR